MLNRHLTVYWSPFEQKSSNRYRSYRLAIEMQHAIRLSQFTVCVSDWNESAAYMHGASYCALVEHFTVITSFGTALHGESFPRRCLTVREAEGNSGSGVARYGTEPYVAGSDVKASTSRA